MAHRTALIAAGSIVIVIAAATVAVGANLGILDAADSRPVGQLSAASDVQTNTAQVAATPPPHAAAAAPQKYIIRKAGTVSVTATGAGLRLSDITAKKGWKWTLEQTSDARLTVTFASRSGSATFKFVAVLGRHHSVVARVDKQVTKVVPAPAAPAPVVASAAAPQTGAASAAPAHTSEPGHGEDSHDGGAEADD